MHKNKFESEAHKQLPLILLQNETGFSSNTMDQTAVPVSEQMGSYYIICLTELHIFWRSNYIISLLAMLKRFSQEAINDA